MKTLRPIPMAHPAIVISSLALIAVMVFWSLKTDLQEPSFFVTIPVLILVIAASEISRRRHINELRRRPGSTSRS